MVRHAFVTTMLDVALVNDERACRRREWGTRAGTIELAIPKLQAGSYYPQWLPERRRRRR